jgi:D-inositol-3-phosphate glycosyltransferase
MKMAERPLRIAMLSVHTCPLATLGGKKTGGMNVYVRELSKELSRHGIRVDVFTRSQDPCVPHVNDTALGEHARVVHVPAGPEAPLSTKEIHPYLPEFVSNVQAFAASQNLSYDLIHSHYWLSGLVAQELSTAWGVPFVQMFHTLGHMKNRIARDDSEREPELRIRSEGQIMRTASRLIAATPAERVQLMWLYGADMRKIRVIPPGVDTQKFYPIPKAEARRAIGIPETSQMLLFVGRIEPLKGIDTLMQAIARLREHIEHCLKRLCLTIIGGEPDAEDSADAEMQRLKALRDKLDLGELVTFLGARSQDTLQYYYSAAEVVVVPSYYESFGMVALEAMACGTPVIASEVGGLAFLIQDGITGFHVPDRDPEELAGKICLLLENEDLHREMSIAAVEHAQQYSWARIAPRIEEVYWELLSPDAQKLVYPAANQQGGPSFP